MKFLRVLGAILLLVLLASGLFLRKNPGFAAQLAAGRPQAVVAYGTSLTASGAWVGQLQEACDAQYPGLVRMTNSGQGAMNSKWGVDNLPGRVLEKNPDLVLIEFAINDAYAAFAISVQESRRNLLSMVSRIQQARPRAEIILLTTNPTLGIYADQRPALGEYYEMYREVARSRKLKLVDLTPRWERILRSNLPLFKSYVPDGLHPDADGCREVVTPAILQTLGLKGGPIGVALPRP